MNSRLIGCSVIAARSKTTLFWSRVWLDTATTKRELEETTLKKFRRDLFHTKESVQFQLRIQQSEVSTEPILKSMAARYLALTLFIKCW